MTWPLHGSNPHYLYHTAGVHPPNEIFDFSANINPLGPPSSIKERWGDFLEGIEKYPDPQTTLLKRKIARREGIKEGQILLGNGGAEIISLLGRMLAGKKVMIIEPTFSEYEKACRANDCEIAYFQLEDGWELSLDTLLSRIKGVDAVFLCNPNNPSGIYYGADMIAAVLKQCKQENCFLIVDEAFCDFVAEYVSLVPYLRGFSQLLLLRSMTKMYAIPGLRLGYMMGNQEIIKTVADYQSHWSVNSIAMKAGELCLEEDEYIVRTIQYIQRERESLFQFYKKNRFDVSNSSVNFYLLRDPYLQDQYPLFRFLLEKGMVPRHTFNFPGLEGRWLRLAIRSSYENKRLMEAMELWRIIHPSPL